MGSFEIFRGWTMIGRRWYFRLVARNGKIIAQSEAYSSKQMAEKGIAAVKRYAATAEIDDLTE